MGISTSDLALDHVNEAAVRQDSVGSKDIEEVWEVGNCDPKVGAWLNLKLIFHHSPAPGTENGCIKSEFGGFYLPLVGKEQMLAWMSKPVA